MIHCAFATSMFAAVINCVYDKVEDLHIEIICQNILTKNYELELN